MSKLTQYNPYGLAEGQPCDHIRIKFLHQGGAVEGWEGVVSLPVLVGADWEIAATQAFLLAKEHYGLKASMMALCSFSYYDDEIEGWVQFL